MISFLLYNVLSVVTISLQASTSCYYPDGTYIAADRPCIGNGDQESFCCGTQGVMCLADKVCHYNDTTPKNGISYGRGSCTDQSWTSPACPNFCLCAYSWGLVMPVADKNRGDSTSQQVRSNVSMRLRNRLLLLLTGWLAVLLRTRQHHFGRFIQRCIFNSLHSASDAGDDSRTPAYIVF